MQVFFCLMSVFGIADEGFHAVSARLQLFNQSGRFASNVCKVLGFPSLKALIYKPYP